MANIGIRSGGGTLGGAASTMPAAGPVAGAGPQSGGKAALGAEAAIPGGGAPPVATPAGVPPTSGGSLGALGLGLDVGVLPVIESPAAVVESPSPSSSQASAETPCEADRFDKGEARDRREVGRDGVPAPGTSRPREVAASPFAKLVPSLPLRAVVAPEPLRVTPKALGLEKAMELPLEAASRLSAVQRNLPPEKNVDCDKVNLGLSLVFTDAQETERARLGSVAGGHASVASKVFSLNVKRADEEFAAWLQTSARNLGLIQANVNAFVQLVLREAYLIGNDQLRDYAEKVKFYNDMKKKIREQLNKARETKATWAEQQAALKEGETFIADPPFAAADVNTSTGDLFVPTATEEDVARFEALQTKKSESGEGAAAVNTYEDLYGESKLSNSDRLFMDKVLEDKDSGILDFFDSENDDFIKDNIDQVKSIFSRMNADELSRYLTPIVDILMGGSTDSDQIIDIYKSLSPIQCVYVQSGGFDPQRASAKDNFWSTANQVAGLGDEVKDLGFGSGLKIAASVATGLAPALGQTALAALGAAPVLGGLSAAFGNPFSGLSESERASIEMHLAAGASQIADEVGLTIEGQATAEQAAQLLVSLRAESERKTQDEASAAEQAPMVGGKKCMYTSEEMDAYIKGLEDKLNTVGDDAQLANVDLQNQLQKQQQLLQTMSNISKMLHDTAMAIIRKSGS